MREKITAHRLASFSDAVFAISPSKDGAFEQQKKVGSHAGLNM
jgi:hypothetical protein